MMLRCIGRKGAFILPFLFTGLFMGQDAFAGGAHYPVTLRNCGRDIIFPKKPERVVAIGQNSVEILYLLGLASRVQATALWYTPVLPQFAEINKHVKMLAYNEPGFENVVAEKPDMIANELEWTIGPAGVIGTYEQFAALSIPVYTAPADCTAKDNQASGDGLRSKPFTMDMIYQEIADFAEIFDIRERGRQVIAALKEREQAARRKIHGTGGKRLRAVFWYSSADLDMDPYVAGRLGAPGYMMKALGITNIIESDNEWPAISWETIVKGNPDMIVLAQMTRRRFEADDISVKRRYLETDPVTSLMPAVRAGRLVVMDAQAMNSSIRVIDGLERLADAISQFGLDQ